MLDKVDKHLIGVEEFKSFLFQGRAKFTLENVETGGYISYKIYSRKVKRGEEPETRFFEVEVTALGDGIKGKVFVGTWDRMTGEIKKSRGIQDDHIGYKTIKWITEKWWSLEDYVDSRMRIYHHNFCSKCSLPLTTPDSIENGIGPICVKTKMKRSLQLMESLGLIFQEGADYLTPANYDAAISFAVENFPHYLDKFYIPARLRKSDEFIANLYELDKYGLW